MPKIKRGATDLDGILLVDKPAGVTSHDVVDMVRKMTGEGRVGHAGTLDPAATGLLIILVGPSTRLSEQLLNHDKTYLARIAFGRSTDTDDSEGKTLTEAEPLAQTGDADFARSVLAGFVGTIEQMPPQFSAIKQSGQRAYVAARKGQTVELVARTVHIYGIELLAATPDSWDISASVSKGTYIRSLARDIGEAVGCPAHLAALRRTRIGDWSVSQATTVEELASLAAAGGLRERMIHL